MIKGEKSVGAAHHLTNFNVTTPLPANERFNPVAVVRWIHRNVPSFAGRVPEEWTDAVIKSLDKQLVHESVIAHSMKLARTPGYDFGELEILRLGGGVGWQYKTAQPPANYVPRVQPKSMGPRGKHSSFTIKQKAAELRAIYDANPHNPAVQKKAMKDLIDLLSLVDDPGPGDPMPGRGRMETDRERIYKVQQEILLTSGELGRQIVLHLGPQGLQRLRGTMPMPEIGPYRGPDLTRRGRAVRR